MKPGRGKQAEENARRAGSCDPREFSVERVSMRDKDHVHTSGAAWRGFINECAGNAYVDENSELDSSSGSVMIADILVCATGVTGAEIWRVC